MTLNFIFVISIATSLASTFNIERELTSHWLQFKVTHNKKYGDVVEEYHRKNVFLRNHQFIEEHNRRFREGNVSYELGMNEYGDLEQHEFVKLVTGYRGDVRKVKNVDPDIETLNACPGGIDYRTKGAVTQVKNQGNCGSCWAFSATGAIESALFLKSRQLVSLSEQNLIDCSWTYGNNGCLGGTMDQAFEYVIRNGGIEKGLFYPTVCRYDKKFVGCTIKTYYDVAFGNEQALENAVCNRGPVSVGIDASHFSFQFYRSGIYDEPLCSKVIVNHGVLVVGYGTDPRSRRDYWIVKNSWGTSYGNNGYIYMSRNKQNQCGIASMASYPVL